MSAQSIHRVLTEFGMWCLGAAQEKTRQQRARQLDEDGATATDIETVCAHVERMTGHDLKATGAQLVGVLKPGCWQDVLKAAQAAAERCPRRDDAHKPEPGAADREADAARNDATYSERQHDQRCMHAYNLLFHDQRGPAAAAKELGVSVADLPKFVRAGAEMYCSPDPDLAVRLLMDGQRKEYSEWLIKTRREAREAAPAR